MQSRGGVSVEGERKTSFPTCEVSPISTCFQRLGAVPLSSLTLPDCRQGFFLPGRAEQDSSFLSCTLGGLVCIQAQVFNSISAEGRTEQL